MKLSTTKTSLLQSLVKLFQNLTDLCYYSVVNSALTEQFAIYIIKFVPNY